MNESALPELPGGWMWTKLGDICSNAKNKSVDGSALYLEIGNIDIQTKKYLLGEKPTVKGALLSKKDDILISRVRPTRGAITITQQKEINVSSAITVLRTYSEISPFYIHYFLAWNKSFLNYLGDNSTGTMYPTVKEDFILTYDVPLAPPPEQRRIVTKIEELFTRLNAGVSELKTTQAQLKRYRQSVLKAACEGKLVPTEAELTKIKGRAYEPADMLLVRILKERREKWNGKGNYKEPATPDTSGLPELPEGWRYTLIETLLSMERTGIMTGPFGSLLKKHEHRIEGVPVLGIENIEAMKFIFGSKIHITIEKSNQLSGYAALPNDVLISRSGTVGEVCVVPEGLGDARISTNLMRVTLAPNGMLPLFFTFLFNGSPFVLNKVSELCKGSTRNFLNQEILFSLIFPLPPLAEQRRIVAEVERRLSVADEVARTVEQSLTQAGRLRQSILKKAFEGRLVAQDASDEPAGVLLERIKAESVQMGGGKRKPKLY